MTAEYRYEYLLLFVCLQACLFLKNKEELTSLFPISEYHFEYLF